MRAIYFFAGPERKGDLKSWLKILCEKDSLTLFMEEFDTLRPGRGQDLSVSSTQEFWYSKLQTFHIVFCTPPCNTHSRATWANSFGPRPLRSAAYPLGFPWLKDKDLEKVSEANSLVKFTWRVFKIVDKLKAKQNIVAFGEHPENLGRIVNGGPGDVPASIWNDPERLDLCKNGWWCGAYRQCKYKAPTPKPTRSICHFSHITHRWWKGEGRHRLFFSLLGCCRTFR